MIFPRSHRQILEMNELLTLGSKIHWFFSFYIEVFKSLVDKEVNIGQKAYDFSMVSQAAFEN